VELGVDLHQGEQVTSFVAKLPTGIVLDDGRAVTRGQLHELSTPLQAQGDARRVLEVRQHVKELRPRAQRLLETFDLEAFVVDRHRDEPGLIGREALHRPQERGRLVSTRSPGFRRSLPTRSSACCDPDVTSTWSGVTSMP
jgi:hypothetical protein